MFSGGSEWRIWDLHLHTRSSFDYTYKSEDAEELLCKSLEENSVSAVVITDHWKIDSARINKLRKLAPKITFFPGVELRTDKGASNLHVILIFSEESDLEKLEQCFQVDFLFKKEKGKKIDDQSVFWTWENIIKFKNEHNAILMIHASSKENGLDEQITNALPTNQAIKREIVEEVDIFEGSKLKDLEEYKKKVFPHIGGEKAFVICSDNHDPRKYQVREKLWLKSDTTFDGLKQCLNYPQERIYLGEVPLKLKDVISNPDKYIESIKINKCIGKKTEETWFDVDLELNSGLVTIIGNKGSGKSALVDIIGFLANSKNKESGSFLNPLRFRKGGKKSFSKQYYGEMKLVNGNQIKSQNLDDFEEERFSEYVQFLPQKYIEDICNDLESEFAQEIDRVIFSYLDLHEQDDCASLQELVSKRSETIENKIKKEVNSLEETNQAILRLQHKVSKNYKIELEECLKQQKHKLESLQVNKPTIPENYDEKNELGEYTAKVDEEIKAKSAELIEVETTLSSFTREKTQLQFFIEKFEFLRKEVKELNQTLEEWHQSVKEALDCPLIQVDFTVPMEEIVVRLENVENSIGDINKNRKGIKEIISQKKVDRAKKISEADSKMKSHQEQVDALKNWKEQVAEVIGSVSEQHSIEGLEYELKNLENYLGSLEDAKASRLLISKQILKLKGDHIELLNMIYDPAKVRIKELMPFDDDQICFSAELEFINCDELEKIIKKFGIKEAANISEYGVEWADINEFVSIQESEIQKIIDKKPDCLKSKQEEIITLYNQLFALEYLTPTYCVMLDNRRLEEMSAGQKGFLLLLFYLLLDKDNRPIIIDQPEDNLDNQSIFDRLVPCILKSKQRRQIIVVTHNPNIAVACDSEQIIYAGLDKNKKMFQYISGSLENSEINKYIVDVLEGTSPAFKLRKDSYKNLGN